MVRVRQELVKAQLWEFRLRDPIIRPGFTPDFGIALRLGSSSHDLDLAGIRPVCDARV